MGFFNYYFGGSRAFGVLLVLNGFLGLLVYIPDLSLAPHPLYRLFRDLFFLQAGLFILTPNNWLKLKKMFKIGGKLSAVITFGLCGALVYLKYFKS